MKRIKIIIEKHPDGYVAYPMGLEGVIVGQGNTAEEALADVKSAIAFHIETFAGVLSNLSIETLLQEIEWEEKWDQTLEENPEALKRLVDRAKKQYRKGKTKEMGFGELLEDMHDLAVIAERRHEGSICLEDFERNLTKEGLL
ncbi:MAG: type II toxin-antitoxin system HicB family antitoxin [Desulfococcaceae bacterium]